MKSYGINLITLSRVFATFDVNSPEIHSRTEPRPAALPKKLSTEHGHHL